MEVLNYRIFGKNQNVLKMQVRDLEGYTMDAVYFGDAQKFIAYYEQKQNKKAAFTYYPTVNEYMGRKTLQIIIQNYQ